MSHPSHVALSDLSVDEKVNVRRHGRGSEPLFAASIKANGVIEPLIVRLKVDGGNSAYTITNGSKRFDALCWLRNQQEHANGIAVTDSYPVPVIIRAEADEDARRVSLVTNVVRADMHPVDMYRAFLELLKEHSREVVCAEFSITDKRLDQILALAKLSPTLQDAWLAGNITPSQAEAMTLVPDHKGQDALYARLSNQRWSWDRRSVVEALKIKHSVGAMLQFVGVDEYEARKGKVTIDLFGTDHRVDNEKLLATVANEKIDALAEKLKADGWSWVEINPEHSWQYGDLGIKAKPSAEEQTRLDELETAIEQELPDEQLDAFEQERDALDSAILARAFKPAHRQKAGCIIEFTRGFAEIKYGKIKPEEKRKVEAQNRAATAKKKKAKAEKAGEPVGVSNALMQRLSEQLTKAAAGAIIRDPELALAAILAGFASGGNTIVVSERGMATRARFGSGTSKTSNFESSLAHFISRPREHKLELLAAVAGLAVDLVTFNAGSPPLKDKGTVALVDAMKSDAFNKAMMEAFDAKDYFNSVAKPMILKAITEGVNADEARKLAGKPKGDIVKFAIANVPKSGWLPPELRTSHYAGPGTGAKKPPARSAKKRGKK